jgi:hypothetical protein
VSEGLRQEGKKEEERKRKEKRKGKKKEMEQKKKKEKYEIDYLFSEIVIHKFYNPYYYWIMKIEGDSYIN